MHMTLRSSLLSLRRAVLLLGGALTLAVGALAAGGAPPAAAASLPCDIYASGGTANAAAQDSFCAGTTCVITEIYDQSGHGNNLTDAPAGGAAGGPDNLA